MFFVSRSPFTCFEILGFDILLTGELKPVLLEVNHTPSFKTDSSLDLKIKTELITDTLNLLNISALSRLQHKHRTAMRSQIRLYGEPFSDEKQGDFSFNESDADLWSKFYLHEKGHLGGYVAVSTPPPSYASDHVLTSLYI